MMTDRGFANEQTTRYFLVLDPFANKRNDLAFTIGSSMYFFPLRIVFASLARTGHFVENAGNQRRIKPCIARADPFYSRYKHLCSLFFFYYSHRSGQHCLAVRLSIAHAGENNYSRLGSGRFQIGNESHAAIAAQIKIEKNDVGRLRRSELERIIAITGFSDDGHAGSALDDETQSCSNDGVIIDQEYPNGFFGWSHHLHSSGNGVVRKSVVCSPWSVVSVRGCKNSQIHIYGPGAADC